MDEDKTQFIKDLIKEGRLQEAIDEFTSNYPNNKSLALQARYNKHKEDSLKGILSDEQDRLEINRIIFELLEQVESRKNAPRRKVQRVKNIALSIYSVFMISLFIFYTFYPRPSDENYTFDVLILPFNPYKSCNIETNNYEYAVLERLERINNKEKLDLKISTFEPDKCLLSREEILRIGKQRKVDVIMWGKYIEGCTDSFAKINYQVTPILYDDTWISIPEYEDRFYNIKTIEEVSSGVYQEFIYYKLFEILASDHLNSAQKKEYDDRIEEYFRIKRLAVKYYINDEKNAILSLTGCWYDLVPFSIELLRDKNLENRTKILNKYINELKKFQNFIREESKIKRISYLENRALNCISVVIDLTLDYGGKEIMVDLNDEDQNKIKLSIADDESFRKKLLEIGYGIYNNINSHPLYKDNQNAIIRFKEIVNKIE